MSDPAALPHAADHWHARVVAWLQTHPALTLVNIWPVLTEVCALLARRARNQAALDFLLWVERGALKVDAPAEASLAQMRRIVSIDADFSVYRDARGRPLVNLLRA